MDFYIISTGITMEVAELDLPPSNETASGVRTWCWSQAKEDRRCHAGRSLRRSRLSGSCVKLRSGCLGVRRPRSVPEARSDRADVLPLEKGIGRAAGRSVVDRTPSFSIDAPDKTDRLATPIAHSAVPRPNLCLWCRLGSLALFVCDHSR